MKTIERGSLNEQVAMDYLISKGLALITSNYRSRFGEIDLIMSDQNTCLLYTSPSPRDKRQSRMPSSA